MDLLETQASEVRYLTQGQVPLAASHSSSATSPPAYPPSAASPDEHSSTKRKHDDEETGGKHQRSKRNRYISIACNECKRRKIKCNGETPCQRCGNLNLACLYAPNCCSNNFRDSEEFKQMTDKIIRLQEQVDSLFQSMNSLRQETLRLAPIHDRILPLPSTTVSPSLSSSVPSSSMLSINRPEVSTLRHPPSFRGPTSTTFTVDVAKNTLHNMGYSGGEGADEHGIGLGETPTTSPLPRAAFVSQRRREPDPLWEFDKDEMIRICRVHEEEIGIMYPVVKIEEVIDHAKSLSAWMETAKRNGLVPPYGQDEGISDLKTLELKIIMCCGLAVEEHGHSEMAIRLFDSLQAVADRKLMSEPADIRHLPFFALLAGYRFLSNDEILAWRVMGHVTRHCMELGMHRKEGLDKIKDEQQRKNAINSFWSAYVLDRRWGFGTGLPYVLQDDKIDPKLPYPDEHPYLVAMITYSKLGARIWRLVDYWEPSVVRDIKRADYDALDREILQWYDTVPEPVKITNFDQELPLPSTPSYNLQRLQIWTRLRLNQIRIWLHTPVLHSASSIHANSQLAQKAVDLAKDTIQYLSRLNTNTNLYRRLQVFYHQFLTSAIAVLFLASTHAPLQFSANCRIEFYMAMELVKDLSVKSWVSQRLWRTVRSLKAYAPRLGLEENGPNPNGVVTMSGLATNQHVNGGSIHSPNNMPPSPYARAGSFGAAPMTPMSAPPPPPSRAAENQVNGMRLQVEMSKIFGGYTGISSVPLPPEGFNYGHGALSQDMDDEDYAEEGGLYGQFRNMF